jgi:hypothetical protein
MEAISGKGQRFPTDGRSVVATDERWFAGQRVVRAMMAEPAG